MFPVTPKRFFSFLRRPLVLLSGSGLLIIASRKTAFALVTTGALLWVYLISVAIFYAAKKLLPLHNKNIVAVFLTGLVSSLYLLLLFLTNPYMGMSLSLIVLLLPVLTINSSICTRFLNLDIQSALLRALSEALFWGTLVTALALIREPAGNMTLSLPGGDAGIIELGLPGSAYAMRIMTVSAGALMLLGYGIVIIRRFLPAKEHGVEYHATEYRDDK
jgi:hypothetical protein